MTRPRPICKNNMTHYYTNTNAAKFKRLNSYMLDIHDVGSIAFKKLL